MAEVAEVGAEFVESSTGLLELAEDVTSTISDSGLEFLNELGGLESGLDLAGGIDAFDYELVGSFAGDSEWFTANNFGDIFGGPEPLGNLGGAGFTSPFDQVSDFFGDLKTSVIGPEQLGGPGAGSSFFGSLVDRASSVFPSTDQLAAQIQKSVTQQLVTTGIRTAAGAISSQTAQIPVVGALATNIVNSTARSVNPLTAQTPGFNPTAGVSLSQLTGITPNIGIPNLPAIQLASLGPIPTGLISNTPNPVPNTPEATSNQPAANTTPAVSQIETSAAPVGYTAAFDPDNNTYSVVNLATGLPVATGLTEQQAELQAQEQGFYDEGIPVQPNNELVGPPLSQAGNLTPEQLNQIAAAQGVDAGDVPAGGITDQQLVQDEAARTAALRDQARQQQTIRDQRQNKAQSGDWRVRLRLAPNSNYLYNDPDCGPVLWPLQVTDGVIFPYTPAIDLAYKANYNSYDLTHSNYKGYFYQNSSIDQINVRATFTAQDTQEANYLLAVIHFFRSATKMFYGQDAQRGSPPPLCYLSGFGDYQFSEHPVVIAQFNYNLPSDVNYIRAQTATNVGSNLQPTTRNRQYVAGNPLSYALQRLQTLGQGINKGALDSPFAPSGSLGVGNPSYVPTKIDIQLSLLPMQSRQQVSRQFSLKGFANGNLLRGGFW